MNKHLQIKQFMAEQNQHVDLENFRFQIRNVIITSLTWPSLQNSATGEVLDILMKFRVQDSTLETRDGLYLDSVSTDDRFHDLYEGIHDGSDSYWRQNDFPMQEPAPVVLPFLAWQIKEDPDDSSPVILSNQLLETIYRSLPVFCRGTLVDANGSLTGARDPTEPRLSTGSKVSIKGKLAQEVVDFARSINNSGGRHGCESEIRFYKQMKRLFDYFVPKEHDPNSAAVQLYWGAIHEILGSQSRVKATNTPLHDHPYVLDVLIEQAEEISARANAIHRGVYYKRNVVTSRGDITQQDTISGSARLLAPMVDALGAIFDMIVQTVRDARDAPKLKSGRVELTQPIGAKVFRYAKNACKLLETARDELIADSNGFSPDENIGPVLTSQAILILLIERLVGGIYGNGNVDIKAIYDECLAQLVGLNAEMTHTVLTSLLRL